MDVLNLQKMLFIYLSKLNYCKYNNNIKYSVQYETQICMLLIVWSNNIVHKKSVRKETLVLRAKDPINYRIICI